MVKLVRSAIPRPLLSGNGIQREVPLQYARLLKNQTAPFPAAEQLLQLLLRLHTIRESIRVGEHEKKIRQRAVLSGQVDQRLSKAKAFKNAASVEMHEKIGGGTFATVHRARWQGNDVAVKQLHLSDEQSQAALKREAAFMMSVSSHHVVRVFGVIEQPLGIIMEYVRTDPTKKTTSSLHARVRPPHPPLHAAQQLNICLNIALGLQDLHDAKILHRDIKASNVLIDEHLSPKIIDFGLSKSLEAVHLGGSTAPAAKGSFLWMAPELHQQEQTYSTASDVYAFGMLIYEIISGKLPWEVELGKKAEYFVAPWVESRRRPAVPSNAHPVLVQLMTCCWEQLPCDRPPLSVIIERLSLGSIADAPAVTSHTPSSAASTALVGPLQLYPNGYTVQQSSTLLSILATAMPNSHPSLLETVAQFAFLFVTSPEVKLSIAKYGMTPLEAQIIHSYTAQCDGSRDDQIYYKCKLLLFLC
jgi:serine/threonine protein kinase